MRLRKQNEKCNQIFALIRQNPKLANIKPEILVEKVDSLKYLYECFLIYLTKDAGSLSIAIPDLKQ